MTERTGTPKQSATPWLIAIAVILVIGLAMYLKRAGNQVPPEAPQPSQPASAQGATGSNTRPGMRIPGQPLQVAALREQRQKTADKRKKVQQEVDRTQAAFASRYSSEPVDAAWAGPKEAELTRLGVSDQIRQLGVEPINMAVDCKSSMCRITGDFATMSSGDDWVTLYMNNVGDKVPVASYKYVQNPDGTVTINVYAVGRK